MLGGSGQGVMATKGRNVSSLNEQPEYPASFVQFKGDRPQYGDARSPLGLAVAGGGLMSPPDFPATPTVDYPRGFQMQAPEPPPRDRPPPPPEPPKPPPEPPGPMPIPYNVTFRWTRRPFRRRGTPYSPRMRGGGFSRFRSASRMPQLAEGRRVPPGGGQAFYG